MTQIVWALLSVLFGSLGQVLLKIGADRLGTYSLSAATWVRDLCSTFRSPFIMAGLALFGSSFLLWVKVLTRAELSQAYPIVSLGYINVAVLSYFVLHESLTLSKVAGMLVIIGGVLLMNK